MSAVQVTIRSWWKLRGWVEELPGDSKIVGELGRWARCNGKPAFLTVLYGETARDFFGPDARLVTTSHDYDFAIIDYDGSQQLLDGAGEDGCSPFTVDRPALQEASAIPGGELCYQPHLETRGMARRRILAEFSHRLKAAIDAAESTGQQRYLMVPNRQILSKHMDWLALSVADRESFEKIADPRFTETKGIVKAVQSMRSLLGMGRAVGRPQGAKTLHPRHPR